MNYDVQKRHCGICLAFVKDVADIVRENVCMAKRAFADVAEVCHYIAKMKEDGFILVFV